MKELFMKSGPKRLFRPFLHQMTMVVGVIVLMALLNGCASTPFVYNIKSKSDLKAEEKVLAGRFVCFENDAPVHCTKSEFLIFFIREGDSESKLFRPDDAGYVYIAVKEGYYDIARIAKGAMGRSGLVFDLDPFPVVLVRSENSVVNFGTFEVRFAKSSGGGEQGTLQVTHIGNYAMTRSEIASRVGKLTGSISDGRVNFLQRAGK